MLQRRRLSSPIPPTPVKTINTIKSLSISYQIATNAPLWDDNLLWRYSILGQLPTYYVTSTVGQWTNVERACLWVVWGKEEDWVWSLLGWFVCPAGRLARYLHCLGKINDILRQKCDLVRSGLEVMAGFIPETPRVHSPLTSPYQATHRHLLQT